MQHKENPREQKEIIWEVVSQAAGLLPAQIMAGRLQSEGIPARAWQEGADVRRISCRPVRHWLCGSAPECQSSTDIG